MKTVKISKNPLNGTVTLPPSKSLVHRAVIMAALAKGKSKIGPIVWSDDITATCNCIEALGAKVTRGDDFVEICGIVNPPEKATLNCHESGSTLRFLMPVAAALGVTATFTGAGRLPERPLDDYAKIFPNHGVTMSANSLPLTLSGRLTAGNYEVSGHVSSQYISGLLMALSAVDGESTIILTSPLESVDYVLMTQIVMHYYGVNIGIGSKPSAINKFTIHGSQKITARDYPIESDWSHSAFFLASAAINGEITLNGLYQKSLQGDSFVFNIFKDFGADISWQENFLVCKSNTLKGIEVDVSNIPDLVPAIAVTAAFAEGKTKIYNAARLRIKESDRLAAMAQGLKSLGALVEEGEDFLIIEGSKTFTPAKIHGFNDHRIVMAFAVLGAHIGNVEIDDTHATNKSYPSFFEDFKSLGGKLS